MRTLEDIRPRSGLSVPVVTILDEDGGLVERRRSEEDRRVVHVRATAKGRSLLRRLDGPVVELHRAQLGHLGANRLRSLSEVLFRARHAD